VLEGYSVHVRGELQSMKDSFAPSALRQPRLNVRVGERETRMTRNSAIDSSHLSVAG
jgi:hypothetical protein